jgi:hypothetical protein
METLRQDFIAQREEVSSELDRIRYQIDSIEIIIKNEISAMNETTTSSIYTFDNIRAEYKETTFLEPPRKKRRMV